MLYPPFCKKKMTHLRDLFSDRNGAVLYPDCALYEVGGNIGKLKSLHCSLWSKQGWHSHVFLLIELMRVARSYVMKCASAKQTWAVHLQLSEQTNAYYTHTRLCCHRRVDTVNRKKIKLVQPVQLYIKLLNLHVGAWIWLKVTVLIQTWTLKNIILQAAEK